MAYYISPSSPLLVSTTLSDDKDNLIVSPISSPYSPLIPLSPLGPFTSPLSPENPGLLTPVIKVSYDKSTLYFYEDLNKNREFRKDMVKHYYYKTLDRWLSDELVDLLNYLSVSGDKVTIVAYNKSNTAKDNIKTVEKKQDFIKQNLFKKSEMKNILDKFVIQAGINWYDLYKNEYFIRKKVKNFLIKKLKK